MSAARSLSSLAGAAVLVLAVSACGPDGPAPAGARPAVVEQVPGSDVKSVTLRPDAAQAIGLTTARVARSTTPGRLTIPYAAVVYYADGTTWTYVETAPDTFRRAPVAVASIDGELATLTDGPAVGATVVVVGAPEVLGAELGIDGGE